MLANIARVPHAFGKLPNATGSPQRIRPLADWQPVLPGSSTPSIVRIWVYHLRCFRVRAAFFAERDRLAALRLLAARLA
jgi:hypothetical protein